MTGTRFALWILLPLAVAATRGAAEVSLVAIPLPGGPSAVGSFQSISVIGQPSLSVVQAAAAVRLEPGFLCVEADDLEIPGDVNGDGSVDGIDLGYVLNDWGSANPRSDIDRDGSVNGSDLGILLSNWHLHV